MNRTLVFSFLFLLTIIVSLPSAKSQHLEVGVMAGISGYDGELAPGAFSGRMSIIHPAAGFFGRYNLNDFFAVRLGLNAGRMSGDDGLSDNTRNLNFESSLIEASLIGEWNILGYQPYNLYRIFSPYLFAGVATARFNPITEYDGQDVELQPLGTEGQGLSGRPSLYNLTVLSIPVGVGAKVALNDLWNVGIEAGVRFTRTDYLDDVSTTYAGYDELLNARGELAALLADRSGTGQAAGNPRGNPDDNDLYFFAGVFLSYNFMDTGLAGARSRTKRGRGCY